MKQNYTHISIVLDRSGSMAQIASDTIGGFNTFIDGQRKVPGDCTVTLVQFDDIIETVFDAKKVAEVHPLDKNTYQPRNSTALYDAVGRTIHSTGAFLGAKSEPERAEKVIFVIITDGLENASREFDRAKIFDMIKHQRENYKWEFVFIGANQDAFAVAQSMNIPAANAMNYTDNKVGTEKLYASMSANVRSMRCGESVGMAWSTGQRDEQEDAKAKP